MPAVLRPGRGRNLTDPLKGRIVRGKGPFSAGPQARAARKESGGPGLPARRRTLPLALDGNPS